MIWIIGGTSEGRQLVSKINDLDNFIVTVATESGKQFLETDRLYTKRLSLDEMKTFIRDNQIELVVDLTHPYATIVSKNAKVACKEEAIDYIRYAREKSTYENCIEVASYNEAYEYLKNIRGTVFLTTGSKNIGDFEKVRGENRFIYRILPALESIEECNKYKLKLEDIVCALGPFSREYNRIMFKEYGADYVIMKDSGRNGGTVDKLLACEDLGISPIVIGRSIEDGLSNLDEIENIIRKQYGRNKGEII